MAFFDLSTLLTGNSSGGMWANGTCGNTDANSPFVITGSTVEIPDSTPEATYTFNYYFSASVGCAGDCEEVSVQVLQNPTAGTPSSTAVLLNDTIDLTALLTGADTGGTWTDDNSSGFNITDPTNVTVTNVGTFNYTYTVTKAGCAPSSATVTVVVTVSCPIAGTFVATGNTVCVDQ